MSGSEIDLDRLADYVGGALDGTPDDADVRHLVTTDRGWAEAYAELLAAVPAVRDDLAALRHAEDATMPADVAARFDAALAAVTGRPPRRLSAVPDLPPVPAQKDQPAVDGTRVRLADRRRRRRWAMALTTAAAVLVSGIGGIGIARLAGNRATDPVVESQSGRNAEKGGAQAPDAASAGEPGPAATSGPVIASGNDYRRDNLATLGRQSAPAASGVPKAPSAATAADTRSNATPDAGVAAELRPLRDPARRAACLTAITREYGGTVALVDFARFEGAPALVVFVDGARAAGGRRWAVVVGPDCGTDNAISDERYHGPI